MLFPGKATFINSVWSRQWWRPFLSARHADLGSCFLSQVPGRALLPTSLSGSSPASCFPDSHSSWMVLSLTSNWWMQDLSLRTPLCLWNTLLSTKPSPGFCRVSVPNQSFTLAEPLPWESLPNLSLLLGDLLRAYSFLKVQKSARTRHNHGFLCWRQGGEKDALRWAKETKWCLIKTRLNKE